MDLAPRDTCLTCRRPRSVCWCDKLVKEPTRTRVVLLQHPREAKVAVGTARMAHLGLPNSELHTGVFFADHPRVKELVALPRTALLFPGPTARAPDSFAEGELENLVVIDGTWPQAKKVLRENPVLQALPRVGLVPRRPGNYRIRKEPAPDCLATIEAVVEVLGVLERDPARFDRLLDAFTWMVDQQLARAATRTTPRRHKLARHHPDEPEAKLRRMASRAVLLHAEVNAHSRASGVPGEPELLHLYARRFSDGAIFEARCAPRRPLAPSAAFHLEIPENELLGAPDVSLAREAWARFLREDDVLVGWGPYSAMRLGIEGFEVRPSFDLRSLSARRFQARPGSPGDAAARLHAEVPKQERPGRAVRVTETLRVVLESILALPPLGARDLAR